MTATKNDGQMLGFELNGTPYFYVRNLQGDIVGILNANGDLVAEYQYDAWGNHLYVSDTDIARINPIRYRGYYWDNATQLYYLQSRYYSPQLRRFLSPDIFLDTEDGIMGTNMYAYCHNDPINYYDQDGYKKDKPWWMKKKNNPPRNTVGGVPNGIPRISDDSWIGPGQPPIGAQLTGRQAQQQFLLRKWMSGHTPPAGRMPAQTQPRGGGTQAAPPTRPSSTPPSGLNPSQQILKDNVLDWIGPNPRVIPKDNGDLTIISADGLRQIRFDDMNTSNPHVNMQNWNGRRWVDAMPGVHRIFPGG
ncbi:MAG: RHS repeat-associated core domain-containing protein [Oscillospiraceae bacterium]|nr:RHS repeat-associated core domain-containing protein [Oscillospiraceae bacterium]